MLGSKTPGWLLAIAMGLAAGCAREPVAEAGQQGVGAAGAREALTTPPAPTPAPDLDGMDIQGLRDRASLALHEQRLYAPQGDSAIDYFLALRARLPPGDAQGQATLAELQPYLVIGVEQALARDDHSDAARLLALLSRADRSAPALPRLQQALEGSLALAHEQAREVSA
ncbi:MAG: energy transducer TonB, partial [Pseudomonadota bacterium]|nr:energy transducer TonB [Pseudomonadota bacterium]